MHHHHPRAGESGINGLVWWLRGIFGLEFNRFPYAKRSWPNAEHNATRRGQMRSIAPRLVAKCGAAAHDDEGPQRLRGCVANRRFGVIVASCFVENIIVYAVMADILAVMVYGWYRMVKDAE